MAVVGLILMKIGVRYRYGLLQLLGVIRFHVHGHLVLVERKAIALNFSWLNRDRRAGVFPFTRWVKINNGFLLFNLFDYSLLGLLGYMVASNHLFFGRVT